MRVDVFVLFWSRDITGPAEPRLDGVRVKFHVAGKSATATL